MYDHRPRNQVVPCWIRDRVKFELAVISHQGQGQFSISLELKSFLSRIPGFQLKNLEKQIMEGR